MTQVAIDAAASATATSGVVNVSITVGNNTNRKLLVFIALYGNGSGGAPPAITSVTWNGGSSFSASELFNAVFDTTDRQFGCWLSAPTVAGPANVAVTLAGTYDRCMVHVLSVYNAHQSDTLATAFGTITATRGTSTAATVWQGCDGVTESLGVGLAHLSYSAGTATLANRSGIPLWISTTAVVVGSAVATITGSTAPASRIIGDIEIASVRTESGGAKTFTWTGTGWTKIGTERAQSTNSTMGWAYRIYNGSNADPVASWTGNSDCAINRHLLRDCQASGTPVAQHGTHATGTASPATSTGANTTQADVLALFSTGSGVNNAFGVPGGSWTERYDAGSATGPTRQAFGTQEVATSGTGTGNTSETNTSPVSWVCQQFELYNAANGDQTTRGTYQNDNTNGMSSGVATETSDTYNTFGWTHGATLQASGLTAFHVKTAPAVAADPFKQYDWPLVSARYVQQPGELRNLLPGLLQTIHPKPAKQTDWPLVYARYVQQPWELCNLLPGLLSFVPKPFAQLDWPLVQARYVQQPGHQQRFVVLLQTPTKPFAQLDWPLVQARYVQQPGHQQRFVVILETPTKPFAQLDWSMVRATYAQQPADAVNLLPTLFGVALPADRPFLQLDWPNPLIKTNYLQEFPVARRPNFTYGVITSTGVLVAQSATLTGTAKSTSLTTAGAILSQAAIVIGTGKSSSKTIDGTIVASEATVFGIANSGAVAAGVAQSPKFLADVGQVE